MIYYNFILSKNVKKNLYFFFKEKYVKTNKKKYQLIYIIYIIYLLI